METSTTLILRLKSDSGDDAWETFVSHYTPLIMKWLQRNTVSKNDIQDVLQDVLLAMAVNVSGFEHNGRIGSFRCWLRLITTYRCRRHWKSQERASIAGTETIYQTLGNLCTEDADAKYAQNRWSELQDLIQIVEADFTNQTMEIFRCSALERRNAKQIAKQFGINLSQVYKAKFRVMSRLKEEAKKLTAC